MTEPLFGCAHCLDTSWRPFRCSGGHREHLHTRDGHLPAYPCGRRNLHAPHGYVERCACVDTNPVIAKRRERRDEAAA
jgi:hypothetical protein